MVYNSQWDIIGAVGKPISAGGILPKQFDSPYVWIGDKLYDHEGEAAPSSNLSKLPTDT